MRKKLLELDLRRLVFNVGHLFSLLLIFTALPAHAEETTWKVAAGRSSIGFTVKHFVMMKVQGRFREYQGEVITPAGNDFSQAKVNVKIPVSSIYTGNADRDNHLKQSEFFDAEKYPNIAFKSTRVVKKKGDQFEMLGMLTIRGVTKPVTLQVKQKGQKTLPDGTMRLDFVATGAVNRYDFGLRWNELTEAGSMVVDEMVTITLEVSLLSANV